MPYARPTDEQQLQLRRAVEEGLDMELEELLEVRQMDRYNSKLWLVAVCRRSL